MVAMKTFNVGMAVVPLNIGGLEIFCGNRSSKYMQLLLR
jgi:hypothetical protein